MKKPNPITIIVLCIGAISILAFTINDELKKRTKTTSGSSLTPPKNVINNSPFITYNPPHGKPGHRHDLPDGAPLPGVLPNQGTSASANLPFTTSRVAETMATTNSVALNPAHGQPGHRCEIAVGAPLDSPPTNNEVSAASVGTAVSGKNPAHGEPGHRCDIAVGAPLNSAPSTSASSAVVPSNSAAAPKTATGMNPAHGQPGHRCDIAVGAPLNSAPITSSTTTTTSNSSTPQLFPNYSFPKKDSGTITPQIKYDTVSAGANTAQ